MKISLEWLKQYVEGEIAAEAVAESLLRGGLPVESIESVGHDRVLDVEVTSNRGDCLSHVGVAREVAALQKRKFSFQEPSLQEGGGPVNDATSVQIEESARKLCPLYTARVIRNVKIGPSPAWMVRRLEALGLRSINNVVDVTNYVMFELGQPLHAFDYDKLRGRRIIVRQARGGEKIVSIDGHERTLSPGMLVIADAERPVAVAGVMGGLETEVGDQTVNVLLESARFDPLSVRKTARALAMKSDSSYRFERGIDPTLAERASIRGAQLIVETAGGELLRGVAKAGADGHQPRKLTLRLPQIKRVLGIDVPADEVIDALSRLGLSPQLQGEQVTVTVPSWRLDLNIERDLIEEVARVIGYERIPVCDEISIRVVPPEPAHKAVDELRQTLAAAGFFEAITFTFVSDALAADFQPEGTAALPRADANVRKADARLRPSLIPGLLEAVRRNETVGTAGAKLFEVGATFGVDPGGKVLETRRVGVVGDEDYAALRGSLEETLGRLNADRAVVVIPDQRRGFARGATGRIEWGGETIGFIGIVDASVAQKLSLRHQPAAAELELEKLIAGTQHVPQLRALPRFPAVRRDLSLVVSESTRYDSIEALVAKQKLENLEAVEHVVTYRGKQVEKGFKSVTITLVFRSQTGTLTSEQVEQRVARVVDTAKSELNAQLRV